MPIFLSRRQKRRRLLKKFRVPGIILLLLALTVIFWGNISWIFNGNVWRQFLSDYFPEYFPRPYVLVEHEPAIEEVVSGDGGTSEAGSNPVADPVIEEPPVEDIQEVERRDILSIPKLGIIAPIITAATNDAEVIHGLLDSGVVLYPGSVPFGDSGQTVILGHSAPVGWPKIKYDWVFSRVDELAAGDMVVVTYDNETRYYKVVSSRVVTPQEGVPDPTVDGNSLALISCWPPGKDLKRIVVETAIMKE